MLAREAMIAGGAATLARHGVTATAVGAQTTLPTVGSVELSAAGVRAVQASVASTARAPTAHRVT